MDRRILNLGIIFDIAYNFASSRHTTWSDVDEEQYVYTYLMFKIYKNKLFCDSYDSFPWYRWLRCQQEN